MLTVQLSRLIHLLLLPICLSLLLISLFLLPIRLSRLICLLLLPICRLRLLICLLLLPVFLLFQMRSRCCSSMPYNTWRRSHSMHGAYPGFGVPAHRWSAW